MKQKSIQAILDMLDEGEIVNLLQDMVSIPSHAGVERQEAALAQYIYGFFSRLGLSSELVDVSNGRSNVMARLQGRGKGKSLALVGHLDTVPPYGMRDPYTARMEGGRIYGLGTVDMKGPLACMMAAMSAIARSGIELPGDVVFAGVIDEEQQSKGTIALLKSGFKTDGAIVGEPSAMDICTGHRGLEWFEVIFKGREVHGGKQEEGINAIEMARLFMDCVDQELMPLLKSRVHPVSGSSSMNYGCITGGTQPSTVAGKCILNFDRRWVPGEKFQDIVAEYGNILDKLRKKVPGFNAELRIMEESRMEEGFIHEGMEIESEHELVRTIARAVKQVQGVEPCLTSFPGWTDAGLFSTYGKIPSLVCGPGCIASAHSSHEYIERAELLPAARVYAMTALNFCRQVGG